MNYLNSIRMENIYVDVITDDGAMAFSLDSLTCSYNIHKLRRAEDSNSNIFTAGKYICVVLKNPETLKPNMFFFDFRANPKNFKLLVGYNGLLHEMQLKFESLVETLNAHYDVIKDQIMLVVGKPKAVALD